MKMQDETIYHIYLKDKCLFNCLTEKQFESTWAELKGMVELMETEYEEGDLTFEKIPPEVKSGHGGSYDDNLEPSY
tara:strand:+ start:456 stop:683 length:228 start_codon:yes stop_codon:yes gene_type:complete